MRFVFSVSNNATRLIKILRKLEEIKSPILEMISAVVIDNKVNKKLREKCNTLHIALYEVDDDDLKSKYDFSNFLLKTLKSFEADYCMLFSSKLLIGEILHDYKNKIFNFHPSILPAYSGFNAIDRAIADGAMRLGNTIHIVDETIDGGPIVMQSFLDSKSYKCYDDVLDMQVAMCIQLLTWLVQNRFSIKGGKVYIENGVYEKSLYIPNLELII